MGSKFFQKSQMEASPVHPGAQTNLEARAIGSIGFTGRSAAAGATKDLGAATALNHNKDVLKPLKRSAAYPAGPKL